MAAKRSRSKQGKASREKGARGEREWRDVLRGWGFMARRGCQRKGASDAPDVQSDLDAVVHWEVKRTETLSLYAALDQAVTDADPSQIPAVVHRRSHKPWIVAVRADDLPEFCRLFSLAYAQAQARASDGREIASPGPIRRLLTGRPIRRRRWRLPT